jgi:hypothetical protein
VYFQRVPEMTTLVRWAATIRPETVQAPLLGSVCTGWRLRLRLQLA